jgi:hypothetical protein
MTLQRDPELVGLLVEGIDERGIGEVAERVRSAGMDQRAIGLALEHLQIAFTHLGDPSLLPEGVALLLTIGELVLGPLERLGLGIRARPERRPTHVDRQPEVQVA